MTDSPPEHAQVGNAMQHLKMHSSPATLLRDSHRLVIKIGSLLLVDPELGQIRQPWFDRFVDELSHHSRSVGPLLVVASGSVALGRRMLGLPHGPLRLEEKQAAAAVGQISLSGTFSQSFSRHGLASAQILLTPSDTEDRRRYLNARETLDALLRHGAIPIINENDTLTTEELRYGDNDRLSARVAVMADADLLLLFSQVDGLYTSDPYQNAGAEHVPLAESNDAGLHAFAEAAGSTDGAGGMHTKLTAARIANDAGVGMLIADGRMESPLSALLAGGRATWFPPRNSGTHGRKRWLSGMLKPCGRLFADPGAVAALKRGKSLLPAGVTRLEGRFARGDAVEVVDQDGRRVACGISAFDSNDAQRILGYKSSDISGILGYEGREELIHRDHLVEVAFWHVTPQTTHF